MNSWVMKERDVAEVVLGAAISDVQNTLEIEMCLLWTFVQDREWKQTILEMDMHSSWPNSVSYEKVLLKSQPLQWLN